MSERFRNRTPASFATAIRYAREWDVDVLLFSAEDHLAIKPTHAGPVAGGIHWPSRTILWPVDHVERSDIAPFIHELSHVLVDVDPAQISEVTSAIIALDRAGLVFLGARNLWTTWMGNFISGDTEWPCLTTRERGHILNDSYIFASVAGLLDDRGEPTFVRKAVAHAA